MAARLVGAAERAEAAGGASKAAGLGRGAQRLIGLVDRTVRELGETWYQRDAS